MKKIIEEPFGGRDVNMRCFIPYVMKREDLAEAKGGNTCNRLTACCSNVVGKVVCSGGYGANCYNFQCNKKFKTVAVIEPQVCG